MNIFLQSSTHVFYNSKCSKCDLPGVLFAILFIVETVGVLSVRLLITWQFLSIIIRLITYSSSLYCLLSLKTPLNARLYDFLSHFPLERTTSRIPGRQANKSRAHPEPKFWWISLLEKQSNPVSCQDILRLPETRTVFWSNLGSRK